MSKTQPMADSRDMIVIHDMFRREFNAIPDPLIYTMESQHEGLAQALDGLAAQSADWRTTPAAQQ